MLFLYRFFIGVLDIELFGIFPEKVLNLCEKNKISIWNICFKKGKICCKINVMDFKKLPKIFKKQGVRLHIVKRRGLPFFTNKYKRRFGVFVGALIFIILLNYLSTFVWVIKIEGNTTIDNKEILSQCCEIGITEGISYKKFDFKTKAQELLLKSDKLSWASFNIEGCVLTLNVTEITEKDNTDTTAQNLVADSDGIITHIDVSVGNCVVKVGDTVNKGDVLVSGIIENEQGTKFVKSRGKIIAETIVTETLTQNYKFKETVLIGTQKTKSVLEIFTLKIPLYLGSEKGQYDSEYKVKNLTLFDRLLPIKLHKKQFIFKAEQEVEINYETACKLLAKQIENSYPNAEIQKEFLDSYTFAELNAKIYESRDIAKSQNLIINTEK